MFARSYNYTIVTKDSDFNDMAIHKGTPPKIENILRVNEVKIKAFLDELIGAILEI